MALTLISHDCVQKLSLICSNTSKVLSIKDYGELSNMCGMFKSVTSFKIDLCSWFKLQDTILPLECLWQLQCHNLIQFTSYLYYNAGLVGELSDGFETRVWCDDEDVRPQCSQTVAGLLTVLVNLGPHSPRDVCRLGQQLLASVVKRFVERLLKEPRSVEEPVQFLPELLSSAACAPSKLRLFCTALLQELVCYAPLVSIDEAVQEQANFYTCEKTPAAIRDVFKVVVLKLFAEDVVNELNGVVTSHEQFNWRWLLTAVSIFAASSSAEPQHIKGLIEKWLSEACTSKNADVLAAALLCARQCCIENSVKFGSYSSWFGNLQVRPATAFTFFFNFLSELVPYEPVLYLKIHVNKVPPAPSNCLGVVADYTTLAKTRLADLNQTTDYVGLFSEYTTTEQEGREADIAKVISYFKQTREVMKVVLEASVFRRQFYEKVFLADLLKHNSSDHSEFIEKLFSMGKIPHKMYNVWCHSKV